MGRVGGVVSGRTQRGEEIRDALAEIADLVNAASNTHLTWARRWFFGIDHDVMDAVTLSTFVFALDGPLFGREVECGRGVARADGGNLTRLEDKNGDASHTELAASIMAGVRRR
jgi:hypothetical protein